MSSGPPTRSAATWLPDQDEVTGTVAVKLRVTSTAPDTDFTAELADEAPPGPDHPLGFDLNVGDSIRRLRDREAPTARPCRTPGPAVPLIVVLDPTSNALKIGNRGRAGVSRSNAPRFDVELETGEPAGIQRRLSSKDSTAVHDAERPSRTVPDQPPEAGRHPPAPGHPPRRRGGAS